MEASIIPSETLADVLGARAKRTPSDRLVIDVVGGLLVAAVAIWARPFGWVTLVSAATCFACYGTWALAERRANADAPHPAWRILARGAAALGLAAFVLLLFAVLGVMLGRQIS